ncbi:hypothetical protein D3C72_1062100 [compost metagenome]
MMSVPLMLVTLALFRKSSDEISSLVTGLRRLTRLITSATTGTLFRSSDWVSRGLPVRDSEDSCAKSAISWPTAESAESLCSSRSLVEAW